MKILKHLSIFYLFTIILGFLLLLVIQYPLDLKLPIYKINLSRYATKYFIVWFKIHIKYLSFSISGFITSVFFSLYILTVSEYKVKNIIINHFFICLFCVCPFLIFIPIKLLDNNINTNNKKNTQNINKVQNYFDNTFIGFILSKFLYILSIPLVILLIIFLWIYIFYFINMLIYFIIPAIIPILLVIIIKYSFNPLKIRKNQINNEKIIKIYKELKNICLGIRIGFIIFIFTIIKIITLYYIRLNYNIKYPEIVSIILVFSTFIFFILSLIIIVYYLGRRDEVKKKLIKDFTFLLNDDNLNIRSFAEEILNKLTGKYFEQNQKKYND